MSHHPITFITAAPAILRPRVSSSLTRRRPRSIPLPHLRALPQASAATPARLPSAPARQPPNPETLVPLTVGPVSITLPGRAVLSLVPLLTASFIACVKLLYVLPVALTPALFNAARLVVASLFFLPLLAREVAAPKKHAKRARARSWILAGLELGLLMFLANVLQIAGLRYTDASRAAFLQQLSTVLVPVVAAALGIESLSPRVAAGAACALGGVALLTFNGPAVVAGASMRWFGDVLEILSALLITAFVLRTGQLVKTTTKPSAMVAVKVASQAVLSLGWLLGGKVLSAFGNSASVTASGVGAMLAWTPATLAINLFLVVWAGVLVSATSSWLQMKGQQAVPPSETAVLFATQPLWATLMAAVLFGDRLGMTGMAGAGMIVGGTLFSSGGKKA